MEKDFFFVVDDVDVDDDDDDDDDVDDDDVDDDDGVCFLVIPTDTIK